MNLLFYNWIRNVLPAFSVNGMGRTGFTNFVHGSYYRMCLSITSKLSHIYYVCFRKNGLGCKASNCMYSPSFLDHIHHIFSLSSYEKMIRVCTFWVIAFVQYAKSRLYFTNVNLIGEPVRHNKFSKLISYKPISEWMRSSCPVPAFVLRFFNSFQIHPLLIGFPVFLNTFNCRLSRRFGIECHSAKGTWHCN